MLESQLTGLEVARSHGTQLTVPKNITTHDRFSRRPLITTTTAHAPPLPSPHAPRALLSLSRPTRVHRMRRKNIFILRSHEYRARNITDNERRRLGEAGVVRERA